MPVVYLNEMQEPDVLERDGSELLQDVTEYTDRVIHVGVQSPTRIHVIWAYCYYRIPISEVAMVPQCQTRDSELAPKPDIEGIQDIVDPVTGKRIGLSFTATAKVADSWQCNAQVACTYHNAEMGRTYTHRRMASFTIASQADIGDVMAKVVGEKP